MLNPEQIAELSKKYNDDANMKGGFEQTWAAGATGTVALAQSPQTALPAAGTAGVYSTLAYGIGISNGSGAFSSSSSSSSASPSISLKNSQDKTNIRLIASFFGDSFIEGMSFDDESLEGVSATEIMNYTISFLEAHKEKFPKSALFIEPLKQTVLLERKRMNAIVKMADLEEDVQMTSSKEELERGLIPKLQFPKKLYGETFNKNPDNTKKQTQILQSLADDISNRIRNLKLGERLVIPGGWGALPFGHAIYYEIERERTTPIPLYSMRIFNSGAGVGFYQRIADIGKSDTVVLKCCPCVEQKNLTSTELLRNNVWLYHAEMQILGIIKNEHRFNEDDIYRQFLPAIHKHFGEKIQTPENYNKFKKPQRSGTCSYKSLMCIFKYHTDKKEYRLFKHSMRMDLLRKFIQLNSTKNLPKQKKNSTLNLEFVRLYQSILQTVKEIQFEFQNLNTNNHAADARKTKKEMIDCINQTLEIIIFKRNPDNFFSEINIPNKSKLGLNSLDSWACNILDITELQDRRKASDLSLQYISFSRLSKEKMHSQLERLKQLKFDNPLLETKLLKLFKDYIEATGTLDALIYKNNRNDLAKIMKLVIRKFSESIDKDITANILSLAEAKESLLVIEAVEKIINQNRADNEESTHAILQAPLLREDSPFVFPAIDTENLKKKMDEDNEPIEFYNVSIEAEISKLTVKNIHESLNTCLKKIDELIKAGQYKTAEHVIDKILYFIPPPDTQENGQIAFWLSFGTDEANRIVKSLVRLCEYLVQCKYHSLGSFRGYEWIKQTYYVQKILSIVHQLYTTSHFKNIHIAVDYLTHHIKSQKAKSLFMAVADAKIEKDNENVLNYFRKMNQTQNDNQAFFSIPFCTSSSPYVVTENSNSADLKYIETLLKTNSILKNTIQKAFVEEFNVENASIPLHWLVAFAATSHAEPFLPEQYVLFRQTAYIARLFLAQTTLFHPDEELLKQPYWKLQIHLILNPKNLSEEPSLAFLFNSMDTTTLNATANQLDIKKTYFKIFQCKQNELRDLGDLLSKTSNILNEAPGQNHNKLLTYTESDDESEDEEEDERDNATINLNREELRQTLRLLCPDDKTLQIYKTIDYFTTNLAKLDNRKHQVLCYLLLFEPSILSKTIASDESIIEILNTFIANGYRYFFELGQVQPSLYFLRLAVIFRECAKNLSQNNKIIAEEHTYPKYLKHFLELETIKNISDQDKTLIAVERLATNMTIYKNVGFDNINELIRLTFIINKLDDDREEIDNYLLDKINTTQFEISQFLYQWQSKDKAAFNKWVNHELNAYITEHYKEALEGKIIWELSKFPKITSFCKKYSFDITHLELLTEGGFIWKGDIPSLNKTLFPDASKLKKIIKLNSYDYSFIDQHGNKNYIHYSIHYSNNSGSIIIREIQNEQYLFRPIEETGLSPYSFEKLTFWQSITTNNVLILNQNSQISFRFSHNNGSLEYHSSELTQKTFLVNKNLEKNDFSLFYHLDIQYHILKNASNESHSGFTSKLQS